MRHKIAHTLPSVSRLLTVLREVVEVQQCSMDSVVMWQAAVQHMQRQRVTRGGATARRSEDKKEVSERRWMWLLARRGLTARARKEFQLRNFATGLRGMVTMLTWVISEDVRPGVTGRMMAVTCGGDRRIGCWCSRRWQGDGSTRG